MRLTRVTLAGALTIVLTACEDPYGGNSLPGWVEAITFADPVPAVVRVGETAELRLRLAAFASGNVSWRVRSRAELSDQGAMTITRGACVPHASCSDVTVLRGQPQDVFEATFAGTEEVVLEVRGVTAGKTASRAAALGCLQDGSCEAWSDAFQIVQVVGR